MALADRGMKVGLRALNGFAGMDLLDRIGMRKGAERILHGASKQSVRTAGTVGRTFNNAAKRGKPARPATSESRGLFDLTPSDEQQMLRESFAAFAAEKLRPAATEADAASKAPTELLAQSAELGITMLGVPEELGGAVDERSAMTSVLVA